MLAYAASPYPRAAAADPHDLDVLRELARLARDASALHASLWAEDLALGGYSYYGYPLVYGPPGFYGGGYWGPRFPGPLHPFWW